MLLVRPQLVGPQLVRPPPRTASELQPLPAVVVKLLLCRRLRTKAISFFVEK